MAKQTIIFRADGGPTIGMGHFTRTLALAEMLNQHFHCIFATRQPSEYQIAEIENICHSRIALPENDSHFDKFLEYLKGDEIVVLDNYYFTTEYQRAIRAKGCKLVCIDDIHDKHYVADLLINHSEGVSPLDFSKENYTQLCIGLKYAILRKPFIENEAYAQVKQYDCLICVGGSDYNDFTATIYNMVNKLNSNLNIAIVLGNEYKGRLLSDNHNKADIYQNIDGTDVARLMNSSIFGIFPASTITIEAMACRLPFLSFYYASNQEIFYNYLVDNQLSYPISFQDNEVELVGAFANLKTNYSEIVKSFDSIIDLKSPSRIIHQFKRL